jgi:hypothetical protein
MIQSSIWGWIEFQAAEILDSCFFQILRCKQGEQKENRGSVPALLRSASLC